MFNADKLEKHTKKLSNENKHSILLVDDEVSNLDALSDLLSDQYNIHTAENGEDALAIIKQGSDIHVIISDQRMPGMKGTEFLEKSIELIPDAIRILLTGYTDADAIIDAINRAQVYHYLSKPFEFNDIFMTLKRGIELYQLRQENRMMLDGLFAVRERLGPIVNNRKVFLRYLSQRDGGDGRDLSEKDKDLLIEMLDEMITNAGDNQ